MTWLQIYDPLHNVALSTAVAALPIVVLLSAIGVFKVRIHFAALLGLAIALTVAIFVFGMPAKAAAATAVYGGAFGLFPIGWIILNLIFLYQLTVDRGVFSLLRDSLAGITPDTRIQVILVAFSFGAFFERGGGIWNACSRYIGDFDSTRLQTAAGLRPLTDREYCPSRVWRAGNTNRRPQ
jgi:lactate permease